jgi:hypothetical protein
VAGSYEHDNEPSGFIKCWEFLEWLSNCWLLRKDPAPWNQFLLSFLSVHPLMLFAESRHYAVRAVDKPCGHKVVRLHLVLNIILNCRYICSMLSSVQVQVNDCVGS